MQTCGGLHADKITRVISRVSELFSPVLYPRPVSRQVIPCLGLEPKTTQNTNGTLIFVCGLGLETCGPHFIESRYDSNSARIATSMTTP